MTDRLKAMVNAMWRVRYVGPPPTEVERPLHTDLQRYDHLRELLEAALAPPDLAETIAHSLWTHGALNFPDNYDCVYGLDDLPVEQRSAYMDLAQKVLEDIRWNT